MKILTVGVKKDALAVVMTKSIRVRGVLFENYIDDITDVCTSATKIANKQLVYKVFFTTLTLL